MAQEPSPEYIVLLDESLMDEGTNPSIAAAWYAYALSHANWISEHYKDKDPAKDYKLAFEEELLCRGNLVQVWYELKEKTPDLKDIYLDEMVTVRDAGFLEEYIWTYHSDEGWPLPENLQLEEFDAWMAENLPEHHPETLAGIQVQ